MNTFRAAVGIAIVFLAAALSLTAAPHSSPVSAPYAGDPSVPPASEALRESKTASQGNVVDMAY